MKKILGFLLFTVLLLHSLNCQEKQPPRVESKKELIGFEEKQKRAGTKEMQVNSSQTLTGVNFRYAARRATPGVVHIRSVLTTRPGRDLPDFLRDFFGDDFLGKSLSPESGPPQVLMGSASGVMVSDDGYIVTNFHVVNEADSLQVVLHDQRSYKANVVGTDPATDLALLKINETGLSFIEFGNSDSVQVGDFVLAVGNPFNLASTVTAGIVSAKARNINILSDRSAIESFIQTDAAVNPGNSGGALVDINGRLIGINAAIASPTGAYAGYSFAIPVEIVKKTIDDILRYGKAMRGYLGIIISDMNGEKAKLLGIRTSTGVIIDSLQPDGAAMQSGLRRNDVITRIGDHTIESTPQLREIIARHMPGEKLALTVIRDGKEKIIDVTLRPEQEKIQESSAGNELLKLLGIELSNLTGRELNQLQISGGVKVSKINEGIISASTNMKEGFIITSVNGKTVRSVNDFTRELQYKKGGFLIEGFYPGIPGKYYYGFGL